MSNHLLSRSDSCHDEELSADVPAGRPEPRPPALPPPVSDAAGAQQQLSIAPPAPQQYHVDVHGLVVDEDLLHAAMKLV